METSGPEALDAQARRSVLTVLFVGVFMAALDAAVIAPAVPALKAAFAVGNSQIGMVTIVFSLFTLASTTLMASLGDRHGRRPVYLLCVVGFAAGSLLIALAPSFWMLLVGRAIQGFSAGGVTPTASAMVGDAFPPEERGKALGLIGATFGMAFLLGPLVASLILVALSWQWIFLINLPVAALVLWMGLRRLPATRAAGPPAPLDWAGIALVAFVLTCLVLGINQVLDEALGLMLWPWLLGRRRWDGGADRGRAARCPPGGAAGVLRTAPAGPDLRALRGGGLRHGQRHLHCRSGGGGSRRAT